MAGSNIPDPNAVNNANSWRAAMSEEDRIKTCQYIAHKLAPRYPNVSDSILTDRTRRFELHAFTHAVSRRNYLEKIADGLNRVESQVNQSAEANAVHPRSGSAVPSVPSSLPPLYTNMPGPNSQRCVIIPGLHSSLPSPSPTMPSPNSQPGGVVPGVPSSLPFPSPTMPVPNSQRVGVIPGVPSPLLSTSPTIPIPNLTDPNAAMNAKARRANVSREERVQNGQCLIRRLAAHYQNDSASVLKDRTRSLEGHAFNHAVSREDYLAKIGVILQTFESQVPQLAQANASHPQPGVPLADVQQPATRQQPQQWQSQQHQTTLQQSQLMHQQQQQQKHGEQFMMRRRQPQQQNQPGAKTTQRKGSTPSRRKSGGPEGKKKGATASAKTSSGTGSSSTPVRRNSQALINSNMKGSEALRRQAKLSGNPAPLSTPQGNNANFAKNECLMALARQQAQQRAPLSAPLPQPGSRGVAQNGGQQTNSSPCIQQGTEPQIDPPQFTRFHHQRQQQLHDHILLLKFHAALKQQKLRNQAFQSPPVPPQVGSQVSPILPQHSQQLQLHQQQRATSNQIVLGTGPESSKETGKSKGAKGAIGGGRASSWKVAGGNQSMAAARDMSMEMQKQVQPPARTQAQMQAPVQAQTQTEKLAHTPVPAPAAQSQTAASAQHSAAQRAQLIHKQKTQERNAGEQHGLPPQGSVPNEMKPHSATGGVPGWSGELRGQPVISAAPSAVTIPSIPKQSEVTIQQRAQSLEASVNESLAGTHRLEQMVNADLNGDKHARIQSTLTAIRYNTSLEAPDFAGKAQGTKRKVSFTDVDNFSDEEGMIRSRAVFECSSEEGLRLAKRQKNESHGLRSLREAVKADCKAAQEKNPVLIIDITEEFGKPVVTCLLNVREVRLPKLVLRVQRGYLGKGVAAYGFERPPMGWVGVVDEIRTRFKRNMATTPASSVGVAVFLDAWARAADAVINGSQCA